MASVTDPARIDELFRQAVAEREEIRAAMADLNVSADDIAPIVLGDREELWRTAAGAVEYYKSVDNRYWAAKAALSEQMPKVPRVLAATRAVAPVLPGCGLVLYLASAGIIGFLTVPKYLVLTPTGRVAGLTSLAVVIVLIAWNRIFNRQQRQLVEELTNALEIPLLDRERTIAENKVNEALLDHAIKPRLRQALNELIEWKRTTTLRVYRGTGLGEVENAELEIATGARRRVESLLRRMPGGCIGLAGPRGAGKTTVLSYICSPRVAAPVPGKNVLTVKTSAPVQYDVREFVLHLYSLVCQAVLRKENADEMAREPAAPAFSPRTATTIRRLASVLLSSALALLLFSVFIASQIVQAAKAQKPDGATMTTVVAPAATSTNTATAPSAATFLEAFEVKPGSFALVAIALLIAGLALLIVSGTNAPASTRSLLRLFGRHARAEADDPPPPESPLVALARGRLEEIRFQYSYSSGWAGTLKIPAGVDLQRTSSRTLARQQRTLPEIVESYVQFVKTLTGEYTVLIGIDELDKMSSTESVHLFLNQVKALFGIVGCFYIVSVSENAIAAFERRGLPLRDVLDSTFDTMVNVDYLTFEQSQELLKKRVIGLSEPFAALCHVLSGGLPRDLIRACRDLLDQSDAHGEKELHDLSASVIAAEVQRKARAISVAVRDLALNDATDVLDLLRPAATEDMRDFTSIFAEAEKLKAKGNLLAVATPADGDQDEHDKLLGLTREAAAFLYFAGTTNELFRTMQVDIWLSSPYLHVERLAVARRSLAVRHAVAERAVTDFRFGVGLPAPTLWPALLS